MNTWYLTYKSDYLNDAYFKLILKNYNSKKIKMWKIYNY